MRKKIITSIIIFIMFAFMVVTTSRAQTMGEIIRQADSNLDRFFSMNISVWTDGNTDTSGPKRAYYCMDPFDHGNANHRNMATAVVDVGANGMSSVNGLSTTNSQAARYAMEVLYYATKSYINREPWGRTGTSPYRLMMMQTSAMYSGTMVNAGLFNSSLPSGVSESYMIEQFGRNKYKTLKAEGTAYVNSTTNSNFKDASSPKVQTIIEEGEYVFVGPYKIQNTGAGSISKAVVTKEDGGTCEADGWASSANPNGVNKISSIPNGSTFYLAFKSNKPDSAKEVKIYKKINNILRARMVFFASDGGQNMASYGGRLTGSTEVSINLPRVYFTNIKITKKDQDSGKLLNNVGFKAYCKDRGWVVDGSPATYTSDESKATIYVTKQGVATIRNINKTGDYTIYEVVNPNFGYKEVSVSSPEVMGNISVSAVGQAINQTYTNKRLYVKISGYVWEDIISQKASIRNYLWKNDQNDQEDKRVNNITVTLKKSDGTIIDTKTTKEINNTSGQQELGAYLFGDYQRDSSAKKIQIEDLNGAYIEFEYNGMCYKSVPVKATVANGSKATDDNLRNDFNNNYATIVKNESRNGENRKVYNLDYSYSDHVSTLKYGGNYIYGYDGQKYPVTGVSNQYMLIANTKDASPDRLLGQSITLAQLYSNNVEEIPNINLGLYEREMPDLAIIEDIESAKIQLNGYTHTYKYNQRFNNTADDGFNMAVKFGNKWGSASYTREMYSADVSYNQQDGNAGKLQMYITYKIAIRNESTNLYTQANQLVNYFDNRYDIASIITEDGEDIAYQVDESYNNNGYKKVAIGANQKIAPQKQKIVYIQYKLKNDAINAVLNEDITLNSVTEISSYSTYSNEGFSSRYAGIDKDSNPETTEPTNRDSFEDDTDSAPSFIVKVQEGDTRVIKGTVWEDAAIQELLDKEGKDRQRKGDGIYNTQNGSKDGTVEKVKVELLETKENGEIKTSEDGNAVVATLYKREKDEQGKPKTQEASQYTTGEGAYEFSGVIPGNYLIRYTYGNNSVIHKYDGTTENINIINYKSTIYRGGSKKSANEVATNKYWYRTETGNVTRLSDAKDDLGVNTDGSKFDIVDTRTKEETITYGTSTEQNLQDIEANTQKFEIKLDYDVNLDNISEFGANLKFIFDNIDFGIIQRPIQDVRIGKEISHVKVTLANGQVIIDGDPRTDDLQHVKVLPDGNIHVEIDTELMQGATLEVEYEVYVDNTRAEIDYNEKDYYIYGIITNPNNWKMATVSKLYDYLSNDLDFKDSNLKENGGSWTVVNSRDLSKGGNLSEKAFEAVRKYNRIFQTEEFANMEPGQIKTVKMSTSKLLSNNENDYSFDNDVETNELKERKIKDSIPGNYVPSESSTHEQDDSNKNIVITVPTGENKDYLPYIILTISALIIISSGVVLIKKKVL